MTAVDREAWRDQPHEAVPAPEAEDVCLDCGRYVDAPLHDAARRLTPDERGALMSGADYFAANGDYGVVLRAAEAILADRFRDDELDDPDDRVVIALTSAQVDSLRGMVRQAIRKNGRGQRSLKRKFGEAYDPEGGAGRAEFYDDLYRTLGGDPSRITNTEETV